MSVLTQFFGSSGGGGGGSIEARVQIVDGGGGASCLEWGNTGCPTCYTRLFRMGGNGGYVYDLHYDLTPGATCPIITGEGGVTYAPKADCPVPADRTLCVDSLNGAFNTWCADFKMGGYGTRSAFGGTYMTECGTPFCFQNACRSTGYTDGPWQEYYNPTGDTVTIFNCGDYDNAPYVPYNYKNKIPTNIYNYVPADSGLTEWGSDELTGAQYYCGMPSTSPIRSGGCCVIRKFYFFKATEDMGLEGYANSFPSPVTTSLDVTKWGSMPCAKHTWAGTRSPNFANFETCCNLYPRERVGRSSLGGWYSDKCRVVNEYVGEGTNPKYYEFYSPWYTGVDRLDTGANQCGIEIACRNNSSTCGCIGVYLCDPYTKNETAAIATPCCYGPALGLRNNQASWKGYVSDITGELREYGAGGKGTVACCGSVYENSITSTNGDSTSCCLLLSPVPYWFCSPWTMYCGSGGGAPYHCVAPPSCPTTDAYNSTLGEMVYLEGSPGSVIVQYPDEYAAATTSSPNVCDCSPQTPGFRTYAFYQPGSITLP